MTHYRELMIGEHAHRLRLDETVAELSNSNVRLQDLVFRTQEESRVSERQRVATEIHDTVGYTLTNLIMMMEAATDLVLHDDPQEFETLMQAAREQATTGLEETRRSLRQLRDYNEPPTRGLPAIAKLVEAYRRTGLVVVQVHYGNVPLSLGDAVDAALYHLVQEGLTNALRHGKATHITILLWISDGRLAVTIRDNGGGTDNIVEGIGFAGMRERVRPFGGTFVARNVMGGFEVKAVIPLVVELNEQNKGAAG
jgi:signal transduction histidine kinase